VSRPLWPAVRFRRGNASSNLHKPLATTEQMVVLSRWRGSALSHLPALVCLYTVNERGQDVATAQVTFETVAFRPVVSRV
jgi:hypothetical protein